MALGNKPLEAAMEQDLLDLVTNQVPERKVTDYKQTLPGNGSDDRREFLYDVSSFANAIGGHLVFGIAEEAGIAKSVEGLDTPDADREISRLENMLRDTIEPRIPGLDMTAVGLSNGKPVIVIRIPRSPIAPHMVKFQGLQRFYSRNSNGKYQMDVRELRTAFELTGTLTDRIRNFRLERIGRIVAGETPIPLPGSARIVLHIVPFGAFEPGNNEVLARIERNHGGILAEASPLFSSASSQRFNFDGYLRYNKTGYTQLFGSGAIEVVDAGVLRRHEGSPSIPGTAVEMELRRNLAVYAAAQHSLGIEPPMVVMLSLIGVNGFALMVRNGLSADLIDRDNLLIPDGLIESPTFDVDDVLRPMFDAIWSAAGWSRCMNYDEFGKWARG